MGVLDLEANINVMPLFVYKKLGLTGMKGPITRTFDEKGKLIKIFGKLKAVLIKFSGFIILVDFTIVAYKDLHYDTVYLCRPFMIMINTVICITGKNVCMISRDCKVSEELAMGRATC